MKITALTSFCVDFFPELDKTYVGGNSLNFATKCKLLGYENTSVIGAIGEDRFGKLIENHLDKTKIDRSRLYRINAPTASNKIFIDENGDRYFKGDSWNGGAFDKFRLSENDWSSLGDSNIVAMPAGDPNLKDLLKRRNENQLIVIDFLDYLGIDFIKEHIDNIDIVFLSGKEEMLDELQELSAQKGKLIVPTLGEKGSVAFFENKRYYHKAIEIDRIVDTTGCGDAFQAAFSLEWIKTKDIKKSLNAGSIAASKVLSFTGGVEQE
ncbi:carbohydrate kinase family protein [Muricauda sp. JGD-17]|uniref:Carbohydrate kinase family protein n=1 Tax=Flagellimonas ochracea TaxID=2696472 RepID=A0A964TCH0_9FLAO|nr:carbohydrate kinase family protein [Allomuricauda ochracea]